MSLPSADGANTSATLAPGIPPGIYVKHLAPAYSRLVVVGRGEEIVCEVSGRAEFIALAQQEGAVASLARLLGIFLEQHGPMEWPEAHPADVPAPTPVLRVLK